MGLSRLLNTARSALLASQAGINVAGHNLANAGTPGYTRQRAEITNTSIRKAGFGTVGDGVQVSGVQRLRSTLADVAYRRELGARDAAGKERDALLQVEAAIADLSAAGISTSFQEFLSAWGDLATTPSGTTQRQMVQQRGDILANRLNSASGRIQQVAYDVRSDAVTTIARANEVMRQVTRLNETIARYESGNQTTASDLRDERDRLLDEMAGYFQITVREDDRGMVSVVSGGSTLVDGGLARTLEIVDIGGEVTIANAETGGPAHVEGGSIGTSVDLLNGSISDSLEAIDSWVAELVEVVNDIHRTGTAPNGDTNIDFFDPNGTTAASIRLSADVAADVEAVASGTSGASADGEVADQIAALRSEPQAGLGGDTFADGFGRIGLDLGVRIHRAEATYEAHEILTADLDAQRQAASGVSVDEELILTMRYNHAYNAAARLVSTADDMFQSLLRM